MQRPSIWLGLFLLFGIHAAPAFSYQDPLPVRKAIEDYLRVQTKALPGRTSFTIGAIDPHNNLAPCNALDVSQGPGAKAWGRSTVTVRCQAETAWQIFVPVHIRVFADYLVAARPIAQGQAIAEADLASQNGDLSDLPGGVLTEIGQAVARSATMPIPVGRPIRGDMLRQALVIQQGQSVKVVSKGPGFQVANEGRALNNAVDGQVAQVRLANGQIVSGIARPGAQVEVGF